MSWSAGSSFSFTLYVEFFCLEVHKQVALFHLTDPDSNLLPAFQVVLVELEEINPDQWALFTESIRHLRKKQGAVCWWKNQKRSQRGRKCLRHQVDGEKGEQEKQILPSLSPSFRFWKEIRYHMPVRGKRAVNAEKTALLQHSSNAKCQKPPIPGSNTSSWEESGLLLLPAADEWRKTWTKTDSWKELTACKLYMCICMYM